MVDISDKILCIWKRMEKDSNSTTFIDVRNDPSNKLYDCIACKGNPYSCPNYVTTSWNSLEEYKTYKKKE